ncbi:MAG: outer membrane protein, partial [Alphaproteobacteria bacterium]
KKKDSLELAFRMGVAMNNALPYLKVGFASSKFDVDGKLPRINAGAFVYDLHKKSKRLNGFLIGTGIDLKVSRNVMMGLAYTYTMYKDLKNEMLSPDGGTTAATATDHKKYSSKPASHNAMLRIAYTF